jgi:hypothetical protein
MLKIINISYTSFEKYKIEYTLENNSINFFQEIYAKDKDEAIKLFLEKNEKTKKHTKKHILEIALKEYIKNEKIIENKNVCRGVFWGKDKEVGNLYHAYCEFCGNLFEDATDTKKECEKKANEEGWIIGKTKETKNIAICPNCIKKINI